MLTFFPLTSTPLDNEFISMARSFINSANSVGASVSPCRTPVLWLNQSVSWPLTRTQLCRFEYRDLIVLIILPCTPYASNLCHSIVWFTLSKAFAKSTKQQYVCSPCCFRFLSIVFRTYRCHTDTLYKPCKPKPKPSTYDPPDNHPLAEIQRPILRPEPKQQICHQHANTDHFGK